MHLDLSEHMQRRIFWMGYYNNEIIPVIKQLLHPGMTFLDVGANIGEISLIASKKVGASGCVIAFEPVHAIAKRLRENLERNAIDWAEVVEQGLSDHQGQARIFPSTGITNTKDKHIGLSSLHHVDPDSMPVRFIEITTLDAYIEARHLKHIDGIKLDIEGAELECLNGALDALEKHMPWIIVEIQEAASYAAGYKQRQILELLDSKGYAFHEIYKTGDLRPLFIDTLSEYQNVLCIPCARSLSEYGL